MVKHAPGDVRRNQLFQAALSVCAEKGYYATRVDDIAARAGLSKGSLYHHFRSKEALFLALFENIIDEFRQTMVQVKQDCTSASEMLRALVGHFVFWIESAPDLSVAMMEFYTLGLRGDEFRRAFLDYYRTLIDVAAEVIQKGVDDGEFHPQTDPHGMAWLFFTAGDGLLFVHLALRETGQAIERLKALLELFLHELKDRGGVDLGLENVPSGRLFWAAAPDSAGADPIDPPAHEQEEES